VVEIFTGTAPTIQHTYSTAGVYQVNIQGKFPRIYFNNEGDRNKILSVDQWGDIEWLTMQSAFYGCENLSILALDAPQFNTVSSLSFGDMFMKAKNLTGYFNHWDTSKVYNMAGMFYECENFNSDIGSRDTSNVSNIVHMFLGARKFNQDISNWDTSKVPNMTRMFQNADNFNQSLATWTGQD
jgi:surface protein